MRVSDDDLQKFRRTLPPAPVPVEPALSAADEAEVIANGDQHDPIVKARRERALTLLRRPAPAEGQDAELLVLLAAASALPIDTSADRMKAVQRLTEIGRVKDPPLEVRKVLERLRITPGDADALIARLLPPSRDFGEFSENWPTGGLA